jgi:glyoxylase-like metal-dependent hydrolase (beta-lactamase superfamily II)
MSRLATPLKLSPHLYVVNAEHPHHDSANVYLIMGAQPLLIDCGSLHAAPYLMRNLASIDVDIRDIDRVVATHGHCDHVQGFQALREANPDLRLLIHPLDQPFVQGQSPDLNLCTLYNTAFHPIPVDGCLPVADGERIPAGDGELAVIHTPGHTPGSICLLGEIDGHRVLFAGDTVEGAMPGFEGVEIETWVAAVRTWKDSLRHIADLDIDWVLNGHEPARGLPITRERLDRGIASFGKMLNPWFFLAADEPLAEEPVVAD